MTDEKTCMHVNLTIFVKAPPPEDTRAFYRCCACRATFQATLRSQLAPKDETYHTSHQVADATNGRVTITQWANTAQVIADLSYAYDAGWIGFTIVRNTDGVFMTLRPGGQLVPLEPRP